MTRRTVLLLALIAMLMISGAAAFKKGEKGKSKREAEARAKGPTITPPDQAKVEVLYRPDDCPRKSRLGDKLTVHYTGTLKATGQMFDTSHSRGPFTFQLGAGQVIRGWDQGMQGMCIGEKRKLTIPPHMAYGEEGHPPVIPRTSETQ